MKISLRKASVLQRSILDAIKKMGLSPVVELNFYDDSQAQLLRHREDFNLEFTKKESLFKTLAAVRQSVSKANHNGGINALLGEMALIDRYITLREGISTTPRHSLAVLNGKLEKMRTTPSNGYSHQEDTVTANVLTSEAIATIADEIMTLKRKKVDIQDRLLELNVQTKIEISEDDVSVLRDANII
jgi:hypothetical protein